MDNQQLNLLTREQSQVLLTARLGDGCILVPFFNKMGIFPKIVSETKKDKRVFYYLCIGKYDGANIISDILSRYPLDCYSYKRWSPETIQKWSKMQEYLKSSDKEYSKRGLGNLWRSL